MKIEQNITKEPKKNSFRLHFTINLCNFALTNLE